MDVVAEVTLKMLGSLATVAWGFYIIEEARSPRVSRAQVAFNVFIASLLALTIAVIWLM